MVGLWSLVHGLASLVLDGKLTPGGPEQVDELVGDTVSTMLEPNPAILSPPPSGSRDLRLPAGAGDHWDLLSSRERVRVLLPSRRRDPRLGKPRAPLCCFGYPLSVS